MENNHINFTSLYNSHYKAIYNFIRLRVKNTQEIEDLTQDVFVKAYKSWQVLPDEKSIKNLLYFMARQRLIDLWKSSRSRFEVSSDFDEIWDEIEDDSPQPEDIFENNERKKLAENILSQLNSADRQLLYLRFIEELEYCELAKIYNLSEENLRQKVSRALQKTKKVVNKKEN